MSVGGPNLGTLLVQRIDAALGTTLSQQTNLVNGARPDAISQAAEIAKIEQLQNLVPRDSRETVDRAQLQNDAQLRQSIERAKLDAQKGLFNTPKEGPNTGTTPSAPTTLGNAARTILALLMNFPEQPAPVQGKQPLVSPLQDGKGNPGQSPGNTTTGTPSGNNATSTTAANQASNPQGTTATSATATTGNTTGTAGPQNPVINMALAAQRVSAQAFGQALGSALQSSGLFYESHLTNMAFGKMPANLVRQEPQAQLSQPANTTATAAGPSTANAEASGQPSSASNARAESTATNTTSNAAGNTPSSSSTQGSQTTATTSQPVTSSLAGLHPETHLMVRQQLEVLANQTINWRGEAWPNTPMDWEIQRREPDASENPEAQTHWATRIKLQLPHLGEVDVRINLVDRRILMHAVAPQSAQTLSENSDMLRISLDSSGLTLSQLVIDSTARKDDDNA